MRKARFTSSRNGPTLLTILLEQGMSPDRIDPTKYKATHIMKPQGYYQDDAVLINGVWYMARTGWKINRPVKVIIDLMTSKRCPREPYTEFIPYPES